MKNQTYRTQLTDVVIPQSVQTIGEKAFASCTRLGSLRFDGTAEQWSNVQKHSNWAEGILATHVQCTNGIVEIQPYFEKTLEK